MSATTFAAGGALAGVQFIPGVDVVVDLILLAVIAGSLTGDSVETAHERSAAHLSDQVASEPCQDCEDEKCKNLNEDISSTRNELVKRFSNMREDKFGL